MRQEYGCGGVGRVSDPHSFYADPDLVFSIYLGSASRSQGQSNSVEDTHGSALIGVAGSGSVSRRAKTTYRSASISQLE
jgi:hypothetical protein